MFQIVLPDVLLFSCQASMIRLKVPWKKVENKILKFVSDLMLNYLFQIVALLSMKMSIRWNERYFLPAT